MSEDEIKKEKVEGENPSNESCSSESCGCGCGGFNVARLFILFIIVIMAIYYFNSSVPVTASEGWTSDLAAAQEVASANDKCQLLAFHTSWCGWCTKMKQDTYDDAKFKKFAADNLVLVMLDGDKDKEQTSKYEITGYPSFVVLGPGGKLKTKIVGYRKTDEFISEISAAIK